MAEFTYVLLILPHHHSSRSPSSSIFINIFIVFLYAFLNFHQIERFFIFKNLLFIFNDLLLYPSNLPLRINKILSSYFAVEFNSSLFVCIPIHLIGFFSKPISSYLLILPRLYLSSISFSSDSLLPTQSNFYTITIKNRNAVCQFPEESRLRPYPTSSNTIHLPSSSLHYGRNRRT